VEFNLLNLLELVGSLGVFLFAMKLMSEALQKVAGGNLRKILAAMTSSRLRGILSGLLITAIIQSSSATTVMVVSFVNAGLLSLMESIGIIMGANIGTTVTAWIISILGFKVKMSVLSLPIIGLTFPLLFSKKENNRSLGEIALGFALLFIGLEFLKSSVPDIRNNPEILSFLANFNDLGFLSTLVFLLIGSVLTVVIQSSSATMALTLVMCSNGWIGFESAAAMVLGENIGTTITANIAAIVANTSAKRAARAHLMFNVFGVLWMLMVFPIFLKGINLLVVTLGSASPFLDVLSIPIALSVFHTTFNLTNVAILVWFAPFIAKTAERLVKSKDDDEEYKLKYIHTGLLDTAEMSLLQCKREIISYAEHVHKMFSIVRNQLKETSSKKFEKRVEKIRKYEEVSDHTEVEIANYLTKISINHLSAKGSARIRIYLNIIDNMESISDSVFNISRTFKRKNKEKASFSPDLDKNIERMFELVDKAMHNMVQMLVSAKEKANFEKANSLETQINKFRNKLRKEHLENIEDQKDYKYMAGVIYNDLFAESEKLADYVYNVCEAIAEIND
jgi:phosphate:Na+ symporter